MHVWKKPKCSKGLSQLSWGQGRRLWPHHPCGPRTLVYVVTSVKAAGAGASTPSSCLGSAPVSCRETEKITALH